MFSNRINSSSSFFHFPTVPFFLDVICCSISFSSFLIVDQKIASRIDRSQVCLFDGLYPTRTYVQLPACLVCLCGGKYCSCPRLASCIVFQKGRFQNISVFTSTTVQAPFSRSAVQSLNQLLASSNNIYQNTYPLLVGLPLV